VKKDKADKLISSGWKVGDVGDFLKLTGAEKADVEDYRNLERKKRLRVR
jgi:hypothetical protein